MLTDVGGQYIRTCSTLGISSNHLFTNIERLGSNDSISYGQLSYDTILTSIQSNNASPLPVNVSLRYSKTNEDCFILEFIRSSICSSWFRFKFFITNSY